jgi:hypothetical protein
MAHVERGRERGQLVHDRLRLVLAHHRGDLIGIERIKHRRARPGPLQLGQPAGAPRRRHHLVAVREHHRHELPADHSSRACYQNLHASSSRRVCQKRDGIATTNVTTSPFVRFSRLWAVKSNERRDRGGGWAGRRRIDSPAMAEAIEHGFEEGDKVWVQDADGRRHPGIFVGNNEAAGWFGGGPSAYVAHPEAHQAEVVSIFRITPRDD